MCQSYEYVGKFIGIHRGNMKIFSKIGLPSSIQGRKMCISLFVVYMRHVHVLIVD